MRPRWGDTRPEPTALARTLPREGSRPEGPASTCAKSASTDSEPSTTRIRVYMASGDTSFGPRRVGELDVGRPDWRPSVAAVSISNVYAIPATHKERHDDHDGCTTHAPEVRTTLVSGGEDRLGRAPVSFTSPVVKALWRRRGVVSDHRGRRVLPYPLLSAAIRCRSL